ncbi:MAG: CRISPR-associated protein, Csh2 family [Thermotoga sp. 50_1627]|uniref:type I-B CRISPR-associated protein Cas7/Csh2 n=1 Tax=Pseudothermotoga sp. TaxID=2033661 RepID=UPI00076DA0CB|nr:MAG: CRISPR-associated protein, Csh2 family [Thermotoga sp. 50_64]KUK24436.1 MAG: CRISPR-associated protein, Csh2 family [Thermotoga sp. 50_1627]MBC7117234.1 type I-B CRISPR-associated protein Cas7/Csh2 [Pseudothermotoga sp.]HBT39536.1 type I-B CRISPR-associated protein Cas7/Csh2 [Pseudothermotoga sp.]HCO98532.1 type I-B CRISPR-associated protein Cas7/Csh2 [Pseudothermotoga sp.]
MKNRSEILFLYDVKWANPNGDPLDENKPRIDEETERCIVTDVRLKRTIRDEWLSWGETIWVSGEAVSPDERRKDLDIEKKEDALKCLDVRLFGAVIPISKQADTSYTGPVQFRPGTSLHAVKVVFQQGTAAFTSQAQAQQRSFREEYLIPYSLIAFYGIANENAAKITGATEEDMQKLLKAIWDGTKNLITRSKMEHNPRLLMRIVYKEGMNYHIGELDSYLELQCAVDEKSIRDISEVQLKVDRLLEKLNQNKDRIDRIELKQSDRLVVLKDGAPIRLVDELTGMEIEVVNLS